MPGTVHVTTVLVNNFSWRGLAVTVCASTVHASAVHDITVHANSLSWRGTDAEV
jgi:hypothetical protein